MLDTDTEPPTTDTPSPALTLIDSPASATTRPPVASDAPETDDTESASPERTRTPPADTLTPSDT